MPGRARCSATSSPSAASACPGDRAGFPTTPTRSTMTEAVIVAACRTAIGTAFKGTLADTSAFDLARVVVAEVIRRAGADPVEIDDVLLGEALYGGGDVARHAAVTAGVVGAPGVALNRHCA